MRHSFLFTHVLRIARALATIAGVLGLSLMAAADDAARNSNLRVCVLTDISGDPDDQQSLVRFLTYANEFDVEGLIATTSCWKQSAPDVGAIRRAIDAYGQVRPNLLQHAPDYPPAEQLRSVVRSGVDGYGMNVAAEQLDNEAVDHIIALVDRPDDRPVWFLSWGGSNTLGGAVMKVKSTRTKGQVEAFVAKIRGYEIALQDDGHAYIAHHFPNAKLISSRVQWKGMSRTTPKFNAWAESRGGNNDVCTHDWVRHNVQQNHGPLGHYYPSAVYLWEGDTPSFLYLIPNGLGSPEHPGYGSWGGRFGPGTTVNVRSGTGNNTVDGKLDEHRNYHLWTDARDTWTDRGRTYAKNEYAPVFRWREAYQHDFQARMDWCVKPFDEANHPPVAVCEGKPHREVTVGEVVHLSAAGSSEPDGDRLVYRWMVYSEAGTFVGDIAIRDATAVRASLTVPQAPPGTQIHVILSVTDDGTPKLTRYRRIILTIAKS